MVRNAILLPRNADLIKFRHALWYWWVRSWTWSSSRATATSRPYRLFSFYKSGWFWTFWMGLLDYWAERRQNRQTPPYPERPLSRFASPSCQIHGNLWEDWSCDSWRHSMGFFLGYIQWTSDNSRGWKTPRLADSGVRSVVSRPKGGVWQYDRQSRIQRKDWLCTQKSEKGRQAALQESYVGKLGLATSGKYHTIG